MEFQERVQRLSRQVRDQLTFIQTEEATKNALIMPFIQMLGYDVFNPTEVTPELVADVGVKKGEKVDYAILKDGRPIMLFECKWHGADLAKEHASQLYRYFSVTEARFGVLTNGIQYRFYSDLDAPNVMDAKPFFEFDLFDYRDHEIEELAKFAKTSFDVSNIINTASELKLTSAIKRILESEFQAPSDIFIRFFATRVYEGRITANVREQFGEATKRAYRQFINEKVNQRLQSALTAGEPEELKEPEPSHEEPSPAKESTIVTTTDELEAYYTVKAILHSEVNSKRIIMRDVQSYCGILLDDNNRRPLCRLYFTPSRKSIGLFDSDNRVEQRIKIQEIEDIYDYLSRLRDTLRHYLDPTMA